MIWFVCLALGVMPSPLASLTDQVRPHLVEELRKVFAMPDGSMPIMDLARMANSTLVNAVPVMDRVSRGLESINPALIRMQESLKKGLPDSYLRAVPGMLGWGAGLGSLPLTLPLGVAGGFAAGGLRHAWKRKEDPKEERSGNLWKRLLGGSVLGAGLGAGVSGLHGTNTYMAVNKGVEDYLKSVKSSSVRAVVPLLVASMLKTASAIEASNPLTTALTGAGLGAGAGALRHAWMDGEDPEEQRGALLKRRLIGGGLIGGGLGAGYGVGDNALKATEFLTGIHPGLQKVKLPFFGTDIDGTTGKVDLGWAAKLLAMLSNTPLPR